MRVQLDRRDLAKYPFLKEAQDWVAGRTGTLEQFLSTTYGKIAARNGARRVIGAITGEPIADTAGQSEPEREVFSYALARILVSCTKDRALIDRLTRFEAGRAWGFLQEEDEAKRAYVAGSIGIDPKARELPVTEYIELVPPKWLRTEISIALKAAPDKPRMRFTRTLIKSGLPRHMTSRRKI